MSSLPTLMSETSFHKTASALREFVKSEVWLEQAIWFNRFSRPAIECLCLTDNCSSQSTSISSRASFLAFSASHPPSSDIALIVLPAPWTPSDHHNQTRRLACGKLSLQLMLPFAVPSSRWGILDIKCCAVCSVYHDSEDLAGRCGFD